MMYRSVLQKSVTVPGVSVCNHITRVSSDRVWISDYKDLILTNTAGDKLHHLTDIGSYTGGHTVNNDGDLIYIDRQGNINKLSTDNTVKTTLIKYNTAPWRPRCVYSSPSTGDLLVGMYNTDTWIGKVVRYNSTGEHIQTKQYNNNTGQRLYRDPIYITENHNGDVIVSDLHRVVVTDGGGSLRFSYTGPPSGSRLYPRGICTDALSHILVCDLYTKSVQMLDSDGHFLSQILTSLHGIDKPLGLSYDDTTQLLWVGSYWDNTVNIYRVVDRDSLTDALVPTVRLPPLPPVPPMGSSNRLLSPGTLGWPRTARTQERHQRKSTYPWTAPPAHFTSTSILERLRLPHTQGRHQLESTYPWIPPAFFSSTRSTLEQLGPPRTQERHQLESTYPWTATPAHVTSTKHPIKFEREFDELPSCSSRTVSVSGYPQPKKIRRTESDQKVQIKETKKEFKVDADLPRGSTEVVPDDTWFFPPKEIVKTEIDLKFLQEETIKGYNEDVLDLSGGSKKIVPDEPMYFPLHKYWKTESDVKFLQDYRAPLNLHGISTPLKKSTSMNQIDALESEIFRSELESVLRRIEYVDCNDICGSSVKHCSIGKIETCSEFRTQGIFGWTKSCSEKIIEARAQKCKCFISTFCVLITINIRDVLAHVKVNELQFAVKHLIDFAIESRNYILLSELVRLYAFHCDFQLETLFTKTSKKINAVIVDTILQSAKCMILRKYASLLQNSIQLSLCHDCEKGKCVTIVLSFKGTIEMIDITQEKVMGKKMFIYNYTNPSQEAYIVFKSCATSHLKETLPQISEKKARVLFQRHSNLTMISVSPCKSIGFSKGNHRVVKKPCILFLCLHKGYIPYGEEEFPRQIGDVEVDVQEGFCNFGNGELLEMGGDIRRKGSKNVGSIGGFVSLPGSKIGLITCAHVVLSLKELEKREIDPLNEVEAFINSAHSYKVCGKVVHAEFPKPEVSGVHSPRESSVDAALIELASPSSVAGYRTVTGEQLLSAGFQTDKPPKFHGEIIPMHNLPNLVSGSVVKYGATTGLTLGCLFNECMHVRINYEDKLKLSDILGSSNSPCDIVVYNQMEIESLRGQFFELGDSGSFVFCINQDDTISCIGMAIGYTSRGACLVTPIENVLKSLNLPVTSNCIIPVEARLSSSIKPSMDTMTILNAISQMKSDFDKRMDDHQKDIQKRLLEQQTDIQKRLLEQQKDIQDIKKNQTKFNPS
ncbi:uncharacterized protein LOC133201963 [Saccostrea echinata]|uniref:uncharacterized protein LOC133201963 n=1 Tax=Saccostrea echinata TaxID=191078 RepID=UPI002A831BD9|nr:uncharacterized protein LOC133201963 [Saccostrea echinata]